MQNIGSGLLFLAHFSFVVSLFGLIIVLVSLINFKNRDKVINLYYVYALFGFLSTTCILSYLDFISFAYKLSWLNVINLYIPFIYIHLPIIYFLFRSIVHSNVKFSKWDLAHFLPFGLLFLGFYFFVYTKTLEERIAFELIVKSKEPVFYYSTLFSILFLYIYYYIIIWNKYRQIKKKVQVNIIRLVSKRFFFVVTISFTINIILVFLLGINAFVTAVNEKYVIQMINITEYILFLFVFLNLKRKDENVALGVNPNRNYQNDKIDSAQYLDFIQSLDTYMVLNEPFLNPNIRMKEVADNLNVSEDYLSFVTNNILRCSFNDLINKYRIDYFISRCSKENLDKYTLLTLSIQSGFNSRTTFYRAFNKIHGMSPAKYLQQKGYLKK